MSSSALAYIPVRRELHAGWCGHSLPSICRGPNRCTYEQPSSIIRDSCSSLTKRADGAGWSLLVSAVGPPNTAIVPVASSGMIADQPSDISQLLVPVPILPTLPIIQLPRPSVCSYHQSAGLSAPFVVAGGSGPIYEARPFTNPFKRWYEVNLVDWYRVPVTVAPIRWTTEEPCIAVSCITASLRKRSDGLESGGHAWYPLRFAMVDEKWPSAPTQEVMPWIRVS